MKQKKNLMIGLSAGALALAILLLAVTGLGGFRVMAGAKTVTDGAELKKGDYVCADLTYILDVIGAEQKNGENIAYYAVAPIGNEFTVIRFPASEFENMDALEKATIAFLYGEAKTIDFHLLVTGGVKDLDETTAQLFADWFNDNASWMSQAGVITAVENYGDYLNGVMIESGRVGGMSGGASVGLTAAALVLAALSAAGFIIAGTGKKRHD